MGSLLDRFAVRIGQLHATHLDLLVEERDGRDELTPLVEQTSIEDIDGLGIIRPDLTRMDQSIFEQIDAGEDGRHTRHEGTGSSAWFSVITWKAGMGVGCSQGGYVYSYS